MLVTFKSETWLSLTILVTAAQLFSSFSLPQMDEKVKIILRVFWYRRRKITTTIRQDYR